MIELERPFRGHHRFDRDTTELVVGRSLLAGRHLVVRQDGRLDWVIRVVRPARLLAVLHAHGWTVRGTDGFDTT